MNLWVVAFPFLMLLGSFGTYFSPKKPMGVVWANIVNVALGIVTLVYQSSGVTNAVWGSFVSHPTAPYLSVSIPLNVLLTLMIAIRLVLHGKNIRANAGPPGILGLYKTIVTMLVESSSLYAVSSLLVIAEGGSRIAYIFLPILAETQVRSLTVRPGYSNRLSNVTGGLNRSSPRSSSSNESPTRTR